MKLRATIVVGLAMLVTACWWPGPKSTVTPTDVRRNIFLWNGKLITVGGWLGTCAGAECTMFTSKSDMELADIRNYESPEQSEAFGRGLGIGFSERFDQSAALLQHQYVLIKGRVNDECRGFWSACYDRTPDIEPISIELARPPREHE